MRRFTLIWWAPFALAIGGALLALTLTSASSASWGSQTAADAAILTLTGLCAVGAAAVLIIGFYRRLPEVALLGAVLTATSVLPLTHGMLLPGVMRAANPGSGIALMAAVPVGLLAATPLLLDGTALGRRIAKGWRSWTLFWVAVVCAAGIFLVTDPTAIAAPGPRSAVTLTVVAASLAGCTVVSLRHLRLFAIGRRDGSLLVSLGVLAPGLATLALLGAHELSPAWWLAHFADGLGLLFAAVGLCVLHWRDRSTALMLGPVLTRDPLRALEVGLTPVVRGFIDALAEKDRVTRDHVVRVSELAMRIGESLRLDATELRAAGLGGLLHDVGKLLTPDHVLKKTGPLAASEREIIERHPIDGELLLAPYPHLVGVAAVVRSHHERPDGLGYPDGLSADVLPRAASAVSVADAWDAMVSDRPYRSGISLERAESILHDGAGSQWSPAAVNALIDQVARHGPVRTPYLATQTDGGSGPGLLAACLPEPADEASNIESSANVPGSETQRNHDAGHRGNSSKRGRDDLHAARLPSLR